MIKKKYSIIIYILTLALFSNLSLFSYLTVFELKTEVLNDNPSNLYDLRLSGSQINITTPENKTYTAPMSGYYPATYGFENDEVNSVPAEWTDQSGGSTYVKVVASQDGHNKVLQLYDTTGGDPYAVNAIDNKESGTVEFWMKNVDMSERIYFAPRHGTDQLFRVLLADNMVVVTAQGGTGYDLVAAAANTWHQISVDFECGTGGYKGLGQNQFAVTYKGIRYGPYNFWTSASYTDNIAFSGFHGHGNYYYVDAVGDSWDPDYSVGDNIHAGLLLSFDYAITPDWFGYSLDGQTIKTILGDTSIPFQGDDGGHNIQVFGNNSIGTMYQSDIRYFTIENSPIISPGLPIELLIIIIVLTSVGSAVLVFVTYFVYNKTKTRLLPTENKPKQAKIKKQKPSAESLIFSCPFCQAELPGGQKFCIYCGAKLVE